MGMFSGANNSIGKIIAQKGHIILMFLVSFSLTHGVQLWSSMHPQFV